MPTANLIVPQPIMDRLAQFDVQRQTGNGQGARTFQHTVQRVPQKPHAHDVSVGPDGEFTGVGCA